MKGLIIVLGAPNSDAGILSEIALNRLECAIRFYFNNPEYKILCTGGFGPHFNTTPIPHARYAIRYLIENQIPETDIIEHVLSSNTIEDATLARSIVDGYKPHNIVLISSDFHMKRVNLVFSKYFSDYNLIFVEAQSTLDKNALDKLYEHERNAIQRLKNNGY